MGFVNQALGHLQQEHGLVRRGDPRLQDQDLVRRGDARAQDQELVRRGARDQYAGRVCV
jgi:hypothetical protein